MTASLANYPLVFEPIYKEKIWGGRAFEILGRKLPGSGATLIGESWEIADLAKTSVSGGGGEAALSVIRNGKLAGKTLHERIAAYFHARVCIITYCHLPGRTSLNHGKFSLCAFYKAM